MTTRPRTDWQKYMDALIKEHGTKIAELQQNQAVYLALDKERTKHLDSRLSDIDVAIAGTKKALTEDIASIKGSVYKMLWVIGGAVILAIVQFILNGGLTTMSN